MTTVLNENFADLAVGTALTTTNTDFTAARAGTGDMVVTGGVFGVAARVANDVDTELASLRVNMPAGALRFWRFYLTPRVLPAAVMPFFGCRAGGTLQGAACWEAADVNGRSKIHLRDGTTSLTTGSSISTGTFGPGDMVRVHYHPPVVAGGTQETQLFYGANLHGTGAPSETLTGPQAAAGQDNFFFGSLFAGINTSDFEQFVADDTAYPAPLPAPTAAAGTLGQWWGARNL